MSREGIERLARRAAAGDSTAARRLVAALESGRDDALPGVPEIADMAIRTIRSLADPEDLEDWLARASTSGSKRVTDMIETATKAAISVACQRYEDFVAKSILSGDPAGDEYVGSLSPDLRIEVRTNIVELRVERLVRRILRGGAS